MIGKPTAARNLDQMRLGALAARSTREDWPHGHWRLSMPLGTALADINSGSLKFE